MNEAKPSSKEINHSIREVNEQCVSVEDWDVNCLMIGLEQRPGGPGGRELPWEGASVEDLKLLAALLLKPLTLVTPTGIVKSPPLANDSVFLRKLGVWAAGVSQWADANRK